jgi:hypothetical protein
MRRHWRIRRWQGGRWVTHNAYRRHSDAELALAFLATLGVEAHIVPYRGVGVRGCYR